MEATSSLIVLEKSGLILENVQIIVVNLRHLLRGPKRFFFPPTIQGNSWHFSHVTKVEAKSAISLS